jgi:hypothetical protein
MMSAVRFLRFAVLILYASYLANVGVLLVMLPWSSAWSRVVLFLPYRWAFFLDSPAVRGALTAFGALHLALLLFELVVPVRARHRSP